MLSSKSSWRSVFSGKKILITLGPTREYLDPVRFLSNASSGKMGLAIARQLRSCRAKIFLVCGPGICPPNNFSFRPVESAMEMLKEVLKRFPQCDIFISAAAVADYRPAKMRTRKIHKKKISWSLPLLKNPDILSTMSRRKTKQFCVGFALEDHGGLKNATKKMKKKNCDLMVLNSPASMESNFINATILSPTGLIRKLGKISKERCAEKLCQTIAQLISKKNS